MIVLKFHYKNTTTILIYPSTILVSLIFVKRYSFITEFIISLINFSFVLSTLKIDFSKKSSNLSLISIA